MLLKIRSFNESDDLVNIKHLTLTKEMVSGQHGSEDMWMNRLGVFILYPFYPVTQR